MPQTDLVDDFSVALVTLSANGGVLSWNRGAEAIWGYTRSEAVGTSFSALILPPSRPEAREFWDGLESGRVRDYESVSRRKDGSVVHTQSQLKRIDRDGTTSFALVTRDITESVYQRQVEALGIQYRGLLEAAPDALVIVNPDGRIVLVNSQTERLFGYRRDELLLQPIELLVPERFRGHHPGHRTQYFDDPHPRPMGAGRDLFGRRHDGTEFPAEISLSPIESELGPLAMAAVRDISERRLQEERRTRELQDFNDRIQEANRMKSEFLANMSHELRTPLNAIIGFAEVIHDGKAGTVGDLQKEFLGDILHSSRHLLQLINGVLDLAKVESGKMTFRPDAINLRQLVSEVSGSLASLTAEHRIEQDLDRGPVSVFLDPDKLRQVLYNYLSNAVKFTPRDGVVTIRARELDGGRFRLEVEDTGIGIPQQDLGRLFREFLQLDAGSGKKYQGTGLGLALTKRLVEAQGGEVGASSREGVGSLFWAVLPLSWPPGGDS